MKYSLFLLSAICVLTIFSCKEETKVVHSETSIKINEEANEAQMRLLMQKHLDAVSQKDLETLQSTMSPRGDMQLILPGTEIIYSVDGFMEYHKKWFALDNAWTFETKILNTKVGETFGMSIVEIMYREPERDGVPYFNRMIVSYDLEKIDGSWYVIKDHASSIEKSTDISQ